MRQLLLLAAPLALAGCLAFDLPPGQPFAVAEFPGTPRHAVVANGTVVAAGLWTIDGSTQPGIATWDGAEVSVRALQVGGPLERVFGAAVASDGAVYFATEAGIVRVKGGDPGQKLFAVTSEEADILQWVGTKDGRVFWIEKGAGKTLLYEKDPASQSCSEAGQPACPSTELPGEVTFPIGLTGSNDRLVFRRHDQPGIFSCGIGQGSREVIRLVNRTVTEAFLSGDEGWFLSGPDLARFSATGIVPDDANVQDRTSLAGDDGKLLREIVDGKWVVTTYRLADGRQCVAYMGIGASELTTQVCGSEVSLAGGSGNVLYFHGSENGGPWRLFRAKL